MPALEAERPLREVSLEPDDERRLRGFQLLSAKPMLLVINVAEAGVATVSAESLGIPLRPSTAAVVVSAPIEAEISRLAPEDQASFLADLGLSEPSSIASSRSYGLLRLISFFTVGDDEVRLDGAT
jgi:ribosome-binding ATPase YchF (GTP1/OBG family)